MIILYIFYYKCRDYNPIKIRVAESSFFEIKFSLAFKFAKNLLLFMLLMHHVTVGPSFSLCMFWVFFSLFFFVCLFFFLFYISESCIALCLILHCFRGLE